MKTTNANAPGERTHGVTRGHVGVRRSGSAGINFTDQASTSADAITDIELIGLTLFDLGDGAAQITAGADSTSLQNYYDDIQVVAASGAAVTLDFSLYRAFDITLTANCTITIVNPPASGFLWQYLIALRQDGTGSRTVTWPASVVWSSATGVATATAPALYSTAAAQTDVLLSTQDGGGTWGATMGSIGPGGLTGFATPAIVLGTAAAAGSASTAIRSDSTIVAFDATVPVTQAFSDAAATGSAAVAARRDHVHGMPAEPTVAGQHAHVAEETHLSDGSTVTWTLDQVYEPGSVIAWNTTTIARLTVTEVPPDRATVSAAGTTGDKIVFDYAASIA